jgi:cell division protein FtsB
VFRSKKVGLLGRILLILLLAYMIYSLINVRQEISAAKAEVEILTEQLAEQEQYNTELSNAIENRDNPDFVEDIAREKLGLVSPHDRVFYITD